MAKPKIEEIAEKLWKDQSEDNWKILADVVKGGNIKYYKVFFEKKSKLNKIEDLRKSYAELYDRKYRSIVKVPIFKKDKRGIEGATIYLKGLMINNRV
ncbi:MAG: hypothetical protein KGH77_03320 [Candidatus Micrarchaeota archaeon]|nr:hypothetical protein [Candidatus Micrarchaeota archaeon]MDE1864431.1 hypothetical protein [Candidatus Micrarchaeota archaeon]